MHDNKLFTTLVLGASENLSRYSNMAVNRLSEKGIPVFAVGKKSGMIGAVPILNQIPTDQNIHTVTLYLNPFNQEQYISQILDLHPKRIIFNPGTENPGFISKAKEAGIEVEVACTLVMLSTGNYKNQN